MADVPARTGLPIDGAWEDRDLTVAVLDTWSGATISAQAVADEGDVERVDQAPYGGVDHPGTTREGPRSTIQELTTEKVVVLRRAAGSAT